MSKKFHHSTENFSSKVVYITQVNSENSIARKLNYEIYKFFALPPTREEKTFYLLPNDEWTFYFCDVRLKPTSNRTLHEFPRTLAFLMLPTSLTQFTSMLLPKIIEDDIGPASTQTLPDIPTFIRLTKYSGLKKYFLDRHLGKFY